MRATEVKKRRLWILIILVPLITSGAGLWWILRMRANDPALVSAEIVSDMVAGRSLSQRDLRDDQGKPLSRMQKDRLCYDVLHPPLKGNKVISEEIVNFKNGMGQVVSILENEKGEKTRFVCSAVKSPEGVVIYVSSLLRAFWDYQCNPTGAANIPTSELFRKRAELIREMAPRLEAIGINELEAEDGELYSLAELANTYENWE